MGAAITVRPIITTGEAHEVNEVFFDEVRIPAGDIVGEPGGGLDHAKYPIGHERTGIARVGQSKREDLAHPAGSGAGSREFSPVVVTAAGLISPLGDASL